MDKSIGQIAREQGRAVYCVQYAVMSLRLEPDSRCGSYRLFGKKKEKLIVDKLGKDNRKK
jgi:hypothetical protein